MTQTPSKEYVAEFAMNLKELLGTREYFWYQKKVIDDLFLKGKKEVFMNLARKSGKSELEMDFLALKAQMIPNGQFYFISFTQANAKQTVWGRAKKLIPAKWLTVAAFKETAMECHFKNGSVIYFLGSNMNTDALIGTEPDSVVFDEFRAHKQEFHDVMYPNCFKSHCQILYGSTPPDLLDVESGLCRFYVDEMERCQKNPKCSYYHVDCWNGNPMKDVQEHYKEALRKAQMSGRMSEFKREYLAELVKGSQDSLLPEFGEDDLIPHQDIMAMLKYIKNPIWVVGNDTSGLSRYGHLFLVIDKDNRDIFILDAITRRSRGDSRMDREAAKMTGQLMWPEIADKFRELCPGSTHKDWTIVWDSHDTANIDDVQRWHGDDIRILKVNKKRMLKEQSYGLIRDLKSMGKIKIGSRASELIDEAKCYHLRVGAESPKKTYDELIDCLRYIIYEFDYMFDAASMEGPSVKEQDAERIFLKSIEEFSNKQNHKNTNYLFEDDYI